MLCAAFCTEVAIETVKVPNFMSLGLRHRLCRFGSGSPVDRSVGYVAGNS